MAKTKNKKEFDPEKVDLKENDTEKAVAAQQVQDELKVSGEAVELTEQVIALTKEKEELEGKLLRQLAEFDNFKKRSAREKDDMYTYAKANCVETILGVIDNFERALETECTDEGFKTGVEMIFTQFKDTLTKLGVEEIEAQGNTFDPELHNAVNQIKDECFDENTVAQVFQKGYKIGDKVIRHAMVVVANP